MSLPRFALNQPHLVAALAMVVAALGAFAFWNTPTDLFPDTVPPQVAVVTVQPGANARDMSDQVTEVLEKELATLSGVRHVTSTSRDEVSSINVEFLYAKPIGEAVVDVQNAVARVQGELPKTIQQPRLYRITDATRPLLTLAVSPREESLKSLADIRLLAENDLKNELLAIDGIADVEIFGGHRPEVTLRIDRDALSAHGLTVAEIMAALQQQNVSAPAGTLYGTRHEYLVNVAGEFVSAEAIAELPLSTPSGALITLRDVAKVSLEEADARGLYHGNGIAAIAINLLRAENGATVEAIRNFKQALPDLERRYGDLRFEITDDQQPLIDLNVSGMRSSLVQAMVLTVLVIFLFLANVRAAAMVSVAIPLSFLAALVVLWFSPYTLNMVTLSGLIVAVGMVVDASVVVLENIHRRHMQDPGNRSEQSAMEGARQVALPVTAGMLTTVVVLVPVIFTSGYTGRIMTPLNMVIIATLIASLLVSLTVIPVLAARLLDRPRRQTEKGKGTAKYMDSALDALAVFYVGAVKRALRHRWLFLAAALIFLVFTMRIIKPLLGGEQMPPMDTGIAIVEFDTDASYAPSEVESVLTRVEQMLLQSPEVKSISSVVGSEPQAVSFGAGAATTQSAKLTLHLMPRNERDADIWQIEERWRQDLRRMQGVRTFRVSEYGATPVSTTKAPFDVIISGPDTRVLDRLADEALARLDAVPGLVDLRRSWYRDKSQQTVRIDPALARLHGTSVEEVAGALQTAVQGITVSTLRLEGFLDIPIRMRYRQDQVADPQTLGEVDISTPTGMVKLRNLATLDHERQVPFITREKLRPTIDLTAGNQVLTIAQVSQKAAAQLRDLPLPAGYDLQIAGSARDMAQTQKEMGRALVIGLVMLFILLFALFRSFLHPLTIMLSIPLAVAGAMWGLLLFDKPFCMPALMGIILLGGTIVNNAILMLDFIINARREGMTRDEAVIESVRLRLRPILMTATSTIVGFSPLIFEMAVGLERMSPLGIAAAAGLLAGTIVTMVYVPLIYVMLDSLKEWLGKRMGRSATVAGITLTCALTLLPNMPARAADDNLHELTLPGALSLALEQNPALAEARAEARRRSGEVQIVRSQTGLRATLNGQASWSHERHNMVPGLAPGNQGFSHLLYQATLDAELLLTDFGATRSRLAAARRSKDAGNLLAQRREDEIIFTVSSQYLDLLTLRDLEDAATASLESLRELDQATQQLVTQGRAARVDKLKVEVQMAERQSQLAELEAAHVSGLHELAALLGSAAALPPLADVDEKTISALLPEMNAEHGQDSLQLRSDLQARAAEAQAAHKQAEAARLDRRPDLRLFAQTGYYGARDPEGTAFGNDPDDGQQDAVIGLKLSIPILDGGLRSGQIVQARAEARAAQARLHARQLSARQELAAALAEQKSARLRRDARGKALQQALETLRIESLKYSTGRGAVRDVLDAEAAVLEARSLLHQAERSILIARLAEGLARGGLRPEHR